MLKFLHKKGFVYVATAPVGGIKIYAWNWSYTELFKINSNNEGQIFSKTSLCSPVPHF